MTVRELKKYLNEYDDDMEVKVEISTADVQAICDLDAVYAFYHYKDETESVTLYGYR